MKILRLEVAPDLAAYVYKDLTLAQYGAWEFFRAVVLPRGLKAGAGLTDEGYTNQVSRIISTDIFCGVVRWEGERISEEEWPPLPLILTLTHPALIKRFETMASKLTYKESQDLWEKIAESRQVDEDLEAK